MRRLNRWIRRLKLFLELLVLLLGIPVPLVNLLQLQSRDFGQLFELQFSWLSLRALIQPLELADLVSALPRSLEPDESRSVLGHPLDWGSWWLCLGGLSGESSLGWLG